MTAAYIGIDITIQVSNESIRFIDDPIHEIEELLQPFILIMIFSFRIQEDQMAASFQFDIVVVILAYAEFIARSAMIEGQYT